MSTPGGSKRRERRINAGKLLLYCTLLLFALWSAGAWYRATIRDWDDCVRNNKCFVCHAPALAAEHTYEDMGKNVRLCPEHSTGLQAWRWLVYGVPAAMLIYEDAPNGTGWIFTPLIRGALILFWGGTMAVCALLILVSLAQLAFPGTDIYDDYFCPAKTCNCGKPIEFCEVRCQQCAVAPGIHPDWRVLITAPCLQSGIANLVGAAIGFVVVVVLIVTVNWLLLALLGGRGEAIIGAITALCMFLAVLGLVTAEYIAWHDIKDPPVFEITVTNAIANLHTSASETEPPKFISASTPLKDVTSVRVSAGRIARLLKYGDVVLCTAEKPDGAFVCQAVDNPHAFKEKVEWLVNNQPLISRLLPA